MNFPLRRLPGRLFYCLISLLLAARLAHATGPATTTYSVPALKSGTYYFQCDVHPTTMNGTFVVK